MRNRLVFITDNLQVSIEHCEFLVDSSLLGVAPTALEPDYMADTEHWDKLKCEPFLDVTQTHILSRLLWVPDLPFVPERYRRKWGQYCLLQRKTSSEKEEDA